MTHLNDGDSFELAINSGGKHPFFTRRVARQLASGSDTIFFETLQALGISADSSDGDLREDDMARLGEIQEELAALVLEICARKAVRDTG